MPSATPDAIAEDKPTVRSERQGAVAILTLDCPQTYNALTEVMLNDLGKALDEALEDADVRALVLTGSGKGFCAGANLSPGGVDASAEIIANHIRSTLNPLVIRMRSAMMPIVVAVNGPAAGAGVGIALCGDFVIAARSAKFVLSFVRLGAVLDSAISMLERLIGPARARAMALLGAPVDAETAERWGLIWKTVDNVELLDEALRLANTLAAGPPLALAAIKRQLTEAWSQSLDDVLAAEASAQAEAFMTEDLREGVAAFQQQRAARFAGR